MNTSAVADRPDLGRRKLVLLLGLVSSLAIAVVLLAADELPGTPPRQVAALLGSLLLVVPFAFSIAKRGGHSRSPPTWFVLHVLAAQAGTVLVVVHASGGDWLSPPGLLLLALGFLVVQGSLARAFLDDPTAGVFASRLGGFTRRDGAPRAELAALIEEKRRLLAALDPGAEEGLFSPTLAHWLRRPGATRAYARLVARERRLVGVRHSAGAMLAEWRRLHIAVAWLFWLGLLAHVVVVTFFAGYAAGDGPVYWWHLAAWGA